MSDLYKLYNVTISDHETAMVFDTTIGVCSEELLEDVENTVPENIDDQVYFWSSETPYIGMDLGSCVVIEVDE